MIVDGNRVAKEILDKLKKEVVNRDPPLQLVAILIGADPGLEKFVDLKKKAAESIGVLFSSYEFTEDMSEKEIIQDIRFLSDDPTVNSILIELPLPKKFNVQRILDAVSWPKDVDLLSAGMQEEYYNDQLDILPPAVKALENLFLYHKIDSKDKRVAIFGQGLLVGKPIGHWLKSKGAQADIIDIDTKNPAELSIKADIIISGVGKPGLITEDMVKDDAVVIDYGYGKEDGVMKGDVDFDSVASKASLITPVPGGMGPLVVAAVLENLVAMQGKNS